MSTTKKINANGTEISVLLQGNENDYTCLTDMARYKISNVLTTLSKTGCVHVALSNTWACGSNCTIQILKASNSMLLEIRQKVLNDQNAEFRFKKLTSNMETTE